MSPPNYLAAMVPKDPGRAAGVKYKEEPKSVADDPVSRTTAGPLSSASIFLFCSFLLCLSLQSLAPAIVLIPLWSLARSWSRPSRHGHHYTSTFFYHHHSFNPIRSILHKRRAVPSSAPQGEITTRLTERAATPGHYYRTQKYRSTWYAAPCPDSTYAHPSLP